MRGTTARFAYWRDRLAGERFAALTAAYAAAPLLAGYPPRYGEPRCGYRGGQHTL